ncbi:MAG: TIR domain-containing protein [Hyphomonadaceae bacterium]
MPLVFVSYSNQDRDIALKLVERLRTAAPEGLEIVIDHAIDAETDAIPSEAYRLPYVGKRLRNANAVLAVLTRSYAESDPCWLEMSTALAMGKIVPLSLDPGLSPAGIDSMVRRKSVVAIAPAWFGKGPGEAEAFETAKFEQFARDLKAEAEQHRSFAEWTPAEPRDARTLTRSLTDALQSRQLRRTGLVWSPGSIAEVQKRRFFAAIDSMSIATGDGAWDIARRKALKALADAPMRASVRVEALMGLIGELTAPSDGAPPVVTQEPWEFIGDMALPIDRDISRAAYMKAGKIPNELRKMFQVLRPGRSKRRAIFALGAVLGGVAGVALTYGGQMLFGQPGLKVATPKPESTTERAPAVTALAKPPPLAPMDAPPPVTPQSTPPLSVPLAVAPHSVPPAVTVIPPRSPASATFVISARGLEASVKAEMERRHLDQASWQAMYSQVISLNVNALCSPSRRKAADAMDRKPLDVIGADTQLTWPTDTDFQTPSRLQECPVYRIPT